MQGLELLGLGNPVLKLLGLKLFAKPVTFFRGYEVIVADDNFFSAKEGKK
jgi:hypothetical protein